MQRADVQEREARNRRRWGQGHGGGCGEGNLRTLKFWSVKQATGTGPSQKGLGAPMQRQRWTTWTKWKEECWRVLDK